MGLKDLRLKLKAFRLSRFLLGDYRKESGSTKKPSWMMPISHGYHVVEDRSLSDWSEEIESEDSVIVQREEIDELEVWFYGVFDARIGTGVAKYMQSHFFDKKLKQAQIRKKGRETMRKAYLSARAKLRGTDKAGDDSSWNVGSASVMVINGEKLVMANMGDYRAVVCRDGMAHQINKKHHKTAKRHWSRKLISGVIRLPRIRILSRDSSNAAGSKPKKISQIVVGAERIESDTEFVILASTGVWEVMKNQEAVNLIKHIENPQEAAECLAKEALTRMSRANISCLVIRFE